MKKWLEKVDWIYVIVPLALLGTFWVIAAFAGLISMVGDLTASAF